MDLVTPPRHLGEYLVEEGLISAATLTAVLAEHRITRERLGRILVKRGFLSSQALRQALQTLGVEDFSGDAYFTSQIPPQVLIDLQVMVMGEAKDTLFLATRSSERWVRAQLAQYVGNLQLKFVPFDPMQMERYLQQLQGQASGYSLLDRLLTDAVRLGYSDLHFTPKSASFSVFGRYLGVRMLIHEGPAQEYSRLAAQIKDRANMDIAERRLPQDGAFTAEINGRNVDFRVATVPVLAGEALVIRVLDPDNAQKTLEQLGITQLGVWREGVGRSDGLCLICGPTGSGKTTTLNATLREMDRFGQAIFTAEDPVEYALPYIGQVNVTAETGLTFDRALKAFMRADPDVIVLGEVRDKETAKAALKMAETGHLVLATLHTESIFGAIQRLQDIGVDGVELKFLLRAVLVQRLMRVTCPSCQGRGCLECKHGGYSGRTVVSECAYFKGAPEVQALLQGERSWNTMQEDAFAKVKAGVTDDREFLRVFQSEAKRMLEHAAL